MNNYKMLARGKKDNGKWVEGFYSLASTGHDMHAVIISGTDRGCSIPEFVDDKTVCKFTGKVDKSNEKIFEGHILKDASDSDTDIFVVVWNENKAKFVLDCYGIRGYSDEDGQNEDGPFVFIETYDFADFEELHEWALIKGNIFDNAELFAKS